MIDVDPQLIIILGHQSHGNPDSSLVLSFQKWSFTGIIFFPF